jgi:hypothetical protein
MTARTLAIFGPLFASEHLHGVAQIVMAPTAAL